MSQKYAVTLRDPKFAVEIGLHPLPENAESLDTALQAVDLFNHTEEEREAILTRLAVSAKEFLSEEEFQAKFPEAKELSEDEDESLAIELNEENYGLVYLAYQQQPEQLGPLVSLRGEMVEEPSGEPTETISAEELCATVKTAVGESVQEEIQALVSGLPEALGKNLSDTLQTFGEGMLSRAEARLALLGEKSVRDAASLSQTEADPAVLAELTSLRESHTALLREFNAFLMKGLRKPQVRDKSLEEAAEALSDRSAEVLRFTLQDLRAEWEAGAAPAAPVRPLADPTGEQEIPEPKPKLSEETYKPQGIKVSSFSVLEELEDDEPCIIRLAPVSE